MGAQCTLASNSFKLPNLNLKNYYNFELKQIKIDQKQLFKQGNNLFNNNQQLIKLYRNLLSHLILLQKNHKFKDPNFLINGQHLSNMYDYKRKNMKLYTSQNKIGLNILQQQDPQLAYLSAVMFFLAQNKQFLIKRILFNSQINLDKQNYAFRFFCNGQVHIVIIDDNVPVTSHNDLKYCLVKQKQIWPCLLQKAWCKMIGSYDQARGLSPQQCFQQITGLPCFSIRIDSFHDVNIYSELVKHQKEGNWMCVVAYQNSELLNPRHVFVVQKFDDQCICLASAYTKCNLKSKQQTSPGCIKIPFHKFRILFEYLIIGYNKKGYVPISMKVQSLKRQQKLYQIDIKKTQDISIRFTQYYNGYLNDNEKSNYDYSPLMYFELYDSKGILHFCQGDDKIYSGSHSIYFTKNIFHTLTKGTYYLRLEIDWQYPHLISQGNLVIYASQNNVQIQQSQQLHKLCDLHHHTLDSPKSVIIKNEPSQKKQYILKFIQKRTNILISIENQTQSLLSLQLSFIKSENFRVKNGKLEKDKKVIVNLGPNQIRYIQIMPEDLKKQFRIQPFTVKKINQPHK